MIVRRWGDGHFLDNRLGWRGSAASTAPLYGKTGGQVVNRDANATLPPGPGLRAWRVLRDADFLTGDVAQRMARASLIGLLAGIVGLLITNWRTHGTGNAPPGGDFVCFWVAAKFAAAGHALAAYDPALIYQAEHQTEALPKDVFLPFYYPPSWLLLLLPFAALPYIAAWLGFAASSFALWVGFVRKLLLNGTQANREQSAALWYGLLGFPGLLLTSGNGQNGFLSAACFAAYGVWGDRRPYLGGAALGLLCYKPQLALSVPVVLFAARRFRASFWAGVSAVVLTGLSAAVFGIAPWQAFFHVLPDASTMFAAGMRAPFKLVSVLGAFRVLGLLGTAANVVQLGVSLTVLVVLARAAWRRPGAGLEAALMAAAALLMTPYTMDYDLPIAAVAVAIVFAQAQSRGFKPWEKLTLLALYTLPLLGPALARGLAVPVAPLVLLAVFACTVRRAAPVHGGAAPTSVAVA